MAVTEDDTPAERPGVLRHEGAHRVSVAPGGHSALSAAPLGPGSRLRPAVGPIPSSLRQLTPTGSGAGTEVRPQGAPREPASTGTVRPARRDPARMKWNPDWGESPGGGAPADEGEWQRRLDQLAQANAETARQVTALERELKSAAQPPRSTP